VVAEHGSSPFMLAGGLLAFASAIAWRRRLFVTIISITPREIVNAV
jgi:hypothetical protein